jgi:hypothetical protein
MAEFNTKVPAYKAKNPLKREWVNFRKGLNLYKRATELGNDEMAQADNIMLEGSGVPMGRWGTAKYFTVNATGSIRGIGTYTKMSTNTYEIFALSDEGYLAKKNGTGSTRIAGQSWPSGTAIRTVQLGRETYVVSKDVPFTKYDGSSLIPFATIPAPTNLTATNISGVSGANTQSWKVSALSPSGGTTNCSTNYVLQNLPFDLTKTSVYLRWTGSSAPSVSGYEIWRGTQGNETFLASVPPTVTSYIDTGGIASQTTSFPLSNTTGGYKSKLLEKYKDRLLLVPADDPTRLVISGRYPYHTNFSISYGGGYIYIDPEGGEEINAVTVQPIKDNVVVYKDHSSYAVDVSSTFTVGNYVLLNPTYQPISTSIGCSSQEAVATVENDTFYFGRDGIYVTGFEPNFLNILRTNEVSARLRPYLAQLNNNDYKNACAGYIDHKYLLSIPTRREIICYDRERGSFAGIWKLPYGISYIRKYYESNGSEKWVLGSYESNQVYVFEKSVFSDDGQTIVKTIRTNKEAFGDWTLLSILRFFYILFSNITGEVQVNILIEDRYGNTKNLKTFNISGSEVAGISGYGIGGYGEYPYGLTDDAYSTSTNEVKRWGTLFQQAALVQIEVTSNANNSNFELLSIKMSANKMGEGSLSSTQRV